jgi:hypothetical protein
VGDSQIMVVASPESFEIFGARGFVEDAAHLFPQDAEREPAVMSSTSDLPPVLSSVDLTPVLNHAGVYRDPRVVFSASAFA